MNHRLPPKQLPPKNSAMFWFTASVQVVTAKKEKNANRLKLPPYDNTAPAASAYKTVTDDHPAKKPLHTGVRTWCHYLFSLSVCVCHIRRFYCLRELYEADFQKPEICSSGRAWANAWDVFHRTPYRGGRGPPAAVDSVLCFGWGGLSCFFFPFFFFFF